LTQIGYRLNITAEGANFHCQSFKTQKKFWIKPSKIGHVSAITVHDRVGLYLQSVSIQIYKGGASDIVSVLAKVLEKIVSGTKCLFWILGRHLTLLITVDCCKAL